jgi:hypothetical protein
VSVSSVRLVLIKTIIGRASKYHQSRRALIDRREEEGKGEETAEKSEPLQ